MSDIITTLHPENDNSVNLYPNIKEDNIPADILQFFKNTDYTLKYGNLLNINPTNGIDLPFDAYIQGNVVYNGLLYYYDTNDSNIFKLRKATLTGEILEEYNYNLGHGNDICVLNNKLFILGSSSQIHVVDISGSMTYERTINTPFNAVVNLSTFNNNIICVGGGYISICEYTNNELNIIKAYPFYRLYSYGSGFQTSYVHKGVLYIINLSSKYTATIFGIDLSNYEEKNVIIVNNYLEHAEIEGISITDNYTYLLYMYDYNNTKQAKLFIEDTPHILKVSPSIYTTKTTPCLIYEKYTSVIDYYISPSGNDLTGEGTSSKPYKTINAVKRELSLYNTNLNDIRIHFKAGDYSSLGLIDLSRMNNISIFFEGNPILGSITINSSILRFFGEFTINTTSTGLNIQNSTIEINNKINLINCGRGLYLKNSRIVCDIINVDGVDTGVYCDRNGNITLTNITGTITVGVYCKSGIVIISNYSGTYLKNTAEYGQIFG